MNTVLQGVKSSSYTISMIQPEYCFRVWKNIRGLLEPAVERSHGRWTMEHLFAALCTGQQTLWVAYIDQVVYGALTTQLVRYPNNSMIACQFLGGSDFDHWGSDMLDMIRRYAKDVGADGIEATARFGFWPFFKSEGFVRSYAVYESEDT